MAYIGPLGGNGSLVPGYPAINDPFYTSIDVNGQVYSIPVSAVTEGYATALVTVGGTITGSDTLTVTINGHGVTYTVVGGDTTLALLATHIKTAINNDSTDAAIVLATSSGPVITLTSLAEGTVGEYSLTVATSNGASETIVASSPTLVLDAGAYIVPRATFTWEFLNASSSGNTYTFYKGFQYTVDPVNAAAMRAEGLAN